MLWRSDEPIIPAEFWERLEKWAGRRRLMADFAVSKCMAHGITACDRCHRNPGSCVSEYGACATYSETAMHWDTCPNRVR